ncbi:MAG: sodium:proton antiporter [Lachnospiraceae bacterium]|nr:sodium:proton antiporter [Candidatus Merdinaster equi]
MSSFLGFFVFILLLVVIFVMINEKLVKITSEIALLIFSLIIGVALAIFRMVAPENNPVEPLIKAIAEFRIDKVLLEVLLCFMMFNGASELKLGALIKNFKPICMLAFLTTVLSSALYGLLFWGLASIMGLGIGFELCFLLGAIISPTDPIAATGILNKMGLPKNVTAIMEGESLFNDGTGVALFIFLKDLYLDTPGSNFFLVMGRELFGAILVGFVISFVLSFVIKATDDPKKHILISLLAVSSCYFLCELFGFSGCIACVVCGIYFSTFMDRLRAKKKDLDPNDYYKDFWTIVDTILNDILYVMIGLSFIFVTRINLFIIVAIAAIVFNLASRFAGVYVSMLATRQFPDGYRTTPFTLLMTVSGLKGGLCLALAMSASEFLPEHAYTVILFITYVTILFTTIVQGLSVGPVYKWIKKKWPRQEC